MTCSHCTELEVRVAALETRAALVTTVGTLKAQVAELGRTVKLLKRQSGAVR